jgi:hypothetical protein
MQLVRSIGKVQFSIGKNQKRAESSGFFGNPVFALCDGCSSFSLEYYKSSRDAVYLPTMQYKVNEKRRSRAHTTTTIVSCLARTEVLAVINIDVFMTKVPGAVCRSLLTASELRCP